MVAVSLVALAVAVWLATSVISETILISPGHGVSARALHCSTLVRPDGCFKFISIWGMRTIYHSDLWPAAITTCVFLPPLFFLAIVYFLPVLYIHNFILGDLHIYIYISVSDCWLSGVMYLF